MPQVARFIDNTFPDEARRPRLIPKDHEYPALGEVPTPVTPQGFGVDYWPDRINLAARKSQLSIAEFPPQGNVPTPTTPQGWQAVDAPPQRRARRAAEQFQDGIPAPSAPNWIEATFPQVFARRFFIAFQEGFIASPAPTSWWTDLFQERAQRRAQIIERREEIVAIGEVPTPPTPQGWGIDYWPDRILGKKIPLGAVEYPPQGEVPTPFVPMGWTTAEPILAPRRFAVSAVSGEFLAFSPPAPIWVQTWEEVAKRLGRVFAPQQEFVYAPIIAPVQFYFFGDDVQAQPSRSKRRPAEAAEPFSPQGFVPSPFVPFFETFGAFLVPRRQGMGQIVDVAFSGPQLARGWETEIARALARRIVAIPSVQEFGTFTIPLPGGWEAVVERPQKPSRKTLPAAPFLFPPERAPITPPFVEDQWPMRIRARVALLGPATHDVWESFVTVTIVFRKTLSEVGTKVGSRQEHL